MGKQHVRPANQHPAGPSQRTQPATTTSCAIIMLRKHYLLYCRPRLMATVGHA